MAREKSLQRKHRTEETRLTQNETLVTDRGKSLQDLDTGISSRESQPIVHVVKKLQELCKAVLAVSTKKQQQSDINEDTVSHTSNLNLDYVEDRVNVGECPLSTDNIVVKEIKITPCVGDNENKANYNLPDSRKLELHNYAKDNEIPKKWIKCNKIGSGDANIDEEKPVSLEKNVAREKGIGIKDIDVCINNIVNTTISCRTRMMDYLTNSDKSDQNINTTTIKTDCSSSSCAIVRDESLTDDYMCDSNSYKKIAVHDVSRLEHSCKYQNQYISNNHGNTDGYYLRKGCLSKNSVLTAISVKVFDNVKYSGIDYLTEEDSGKYCRERQFTPPDLQFRMGKRKRGTHSLMEDVSDNSLSSNEPYETSKRIHLNEDMISNDMHRFSCEGVSDLRLVRSFPYSLKSGSNMLPDSITFSDMKSQICSTSAQSPEMFPVHNGIRNISNLNSDVGIITRCKQDTSSDVLDCTTRNSSLKSRDDVTDSFSGLYAGKLYEDFRILRSSISVPYPSVSTSSGNRTSQGTRPGSENLKCQEEELLRRIEESLAETETLKYQEEELLKRIERSLSETESLKCREEELLKKIERSLTKAESLKSREEELLRRIEVSLAHTETAKSQDEILKRIEDVNCNIEFESKYKPDLDYTLPLKKRKRLKTYDENRSLKLETDNTQPESFPSFPSRPMISIAELMARPVFGIAELEAHQMFNSLESSSAASLDSSSSATSILPRYNEHDICDASIYPRDVSIGYLCRNHSMCDRKTENDRFFPVCNKTGDSYRETCNTCAVPKTRNKNYRMPCAEILKEESQPATSEYWQFNARYMRNFENLSAEDGDVIEDSKANLNMIVGKSNSEVDTTGNLELCQKNKGYSTDSCMVNDSKTSMELFQGTEMPSGLKHKVEHTKSNSEFQNCMGFQVDSKIAPIDSKHIKIEEESSDSTDSRYIPYRSCFNNADFISENLENEEHRVNETKLLKIEVETKDNGE
ncbi:uncharacterized protein [Periplaneta americana]|uniref:uncharacterized protein n=1 Tax=Periplaneta americana TaxID=6978 RepID=UPI0037E7B9B3